MRELRAGGHQHPMKGPAGYLPWAGERLLSLREGGGEGQGEGTRTQKGIGEPLEENGRKTLVHGGQRMTSVFLIKLRDAYWQVRAEGILNDMVKLRRGLMRNVLEGGEDLNRKHCILGRHGCIREHQRCIEGEQQHLPRSSPEPLLILGEKAEHLNIKVM